MSGTWSEPRNSKQRTKDPRGSWRIGKLYKKATNRYIRRKGKNVKAEN